MEETAVGVVPLLRQSRTALSSDLRHIYCIIKSPAVVFCRRGFLDEFWFLYYTIDRKKVKMEKLRGYLDEL